MNTKTALVIGGTDGVGRSVTKALAETGHQVTFVGRDAGKAQALMASIDAADDGSCEFVALDLCQLQAVQEFAANYVAANSQLDLLVFAAGTLLPHRAESDGLERNLATIFLSNLLLSDRLVPLLQQSGHARVLYVVGDRRSMHRTRLDFSDLQLQHGYNALKAAMRALHARTVLADHLSRVLGGNAQVIAFFPGLVQSGLTRNLPRFMHWIAQVFGRVFLAKDSTAGIYLCVSDDVQGQSGRYFVRGKFLPLAFEPDYRDQVISAGRSLIQQRIRTGGH